MLKERKHLPAYSDGMARIYRDRGERTAFGAKVSAKSPDDLDFVAKVAFQELSVREQDYQFAELMGFDVSRKVRARPVPGVDSGCKAEIGGLFYDVSHIDRAKTEMYLYLEGGAPLG